MPETAFNQDDFVVLRTVASFLNIPTAHAQAASKLLEDGATIPFVARYRKEVTGAMDEVALREFRDALQTARELETRRAGILASLEERDLLSEDLEAAIRGAQTKTVLEDLYLPFRPKRRTRAMAAREAGLEPLADRLWNQQDGAARGEDFVNPDKGIEDADAALAGARDILAERIAENAELRGRLRKSTQQEACLVSTAVKTRLTEEKASVYKDYVDYSEALHKAPSHRILAVLRGAKEGYLRIKARLEDERALPLLERETIRGRGPAAKQVYQATKDAWTRLLAPSLENEALAEAKERADREAIRVFASNVTKLLLDAPMGEKAVLAIDPGYRTGGKVAVLDPQGTFLDSAVIHPEGSEQGRSAATRILRDLARKHKVVVVAVGDGTAGRETEDFARQALPDTPVVSVDERGASVYSASDEARREFPDLDLTIRGAISIGRRLQDPLAELVKIDPAAIGVGQYQHDVDQKALAASLDDTVVEAVNAVGVNLNSASAALLTRVSGLGPKLADAVVKHRQEQGPFKSRKDVMKVPRLGAKAYEQAAGFLRIPDGRHPLDRSAVHPERYALVESMARDLGVSVNDLMDDASLRRSVDLNRYVDPSGSAPVGLPTLKDIMAELEKPGRDPRGSFHQFAFDDRIHSLEDLEPGMILPGKVTNVTAFGAFVDVGAHQDGLVHISQLADRFVKDPSEIVAVRDEVSVKVLDVDRQRKRIALSMKNVN